MSHLEIKHIPEIALEDVPGGAFQLIKSAVQNPEWDYRTIRGIQEETGVQAEYIASVLDLSGVARRTVFVDDYKQAVYAPTEKPKSSEEIEAESAVAVNEYVVLEGPIDIVLAEALEDSVSPAEAGL